jgi:threonine aldolase
MAKAARAGSTPRILDFRSDTVTHPTDAMRRAMADAEVGDDVYGDDPTVNKLQDKVAKLLGKEAALFVPTGTMGNQVALWNLTGRNGAIVAETHSHISFYEGGAAALLYGAAVLPVQGNAGTFSPEDLDRFWLPRDPHFAHVKVVALENTHNWSGGRTWTAAQTKAVADAAHANGAQVHLDGARVWNAAVARKTTPAALCKPADTVMVCLSKGLSAPVGSLVAGTAEFVAQARFARKALGGGMRQAGHLAAAGIVALDTCYERLADDHANAKRLAKGLADQGFGVDVTGTETNMVMADTTGTGWSVDAFSAALKGAAVWGGRRDAGPVVRFVTHRNVSTADVKEALERIAALRPPGKAGQAAAKRSG